MGCMGLRVLLRRGVRVAAVFTYADKPGENCWFDSVEALARGNGLPVFVDQDLRHPYWAGYARRLEPDVLFSFYYRDLLPAPLLEAPRHGAVNLHGSLLPKYRGRAPVNWQLVNGETVSGVTYHYMEAKADAGDIIAQKRVDVDIEDTAVTLFKKLERAAEEALEENLDAMLAGTAPRVPQDSAQATVFGGRRPEDGRIRPEMTAAQAYNLVRAVTDPYPGAFVEQDGKKIILWKVRPVPGLVPQGAPGTVARRDDGEYLVARDGMLKIESSAIVEP